MFFVTGLLLFVLGVAILWVIPAENLKHGKMKPRGYVILLLTLVVGPLFMVGSILAKIWQIMP